MDSSNEQQLYSISAEQSVLGGVMIDENAYHRISLSESDFGRESHRLIWRAIVSLREEGEPTDPVTVSDRLEAWKEHSVGLSYIGPLADETPSAANITGYARVVREHAIRRSLISAATSLQDAARDRQRDVTDVIDTAQRDVLALSSTGQQSRLAPLSAYIGDFLDDTERRMNAEDGMVGVPTGHQDVDSLIQGFEGGDLVIIAGRPSMGKTMLGEQWAEHMAGATGKPVPFFSLEMPALQLLRRAAARNARIPLATLRSGQLEDHQWGPLNEAMKAVKKTPLYVDDTPALTFAELRSRARRLHQQEPVAAIFVDYLQIVQSGELTSRDARADQKIGGVASGLKALAKELDVPVIAVAQLNRGVDGRSDKRPQMSDLREAGQIEQDADVISFVYRDDVYDPNSDHKGIAELIVRKQRNGPTGTVFLSCLAEYQSFENFAGKLPEPSAPPKAQGMPGYEPAIGA
ncbi:MAG: replicative DNA helicase [Salinirussus sp.]